MPPLLTPSALGRALTSTRVKGATLLCFQLFSCVPSTQVKGATLHCFKLFACALQAADAALFELCDQSPLSKSSTQSFMVRPLSNLKLLDAMMSIQGQDTILGTSDGLGDP